MHWGTCARLRASHVNPCLLSGRKFQKYEDAFCARAHDRCRFNNKLLTLSMRRPVSVSALFNPAVQVGTSPREKPDGVLDLGLDVLLLLLWVDRAGMCKGMSGEVVR